LRKSSTSWSERFSKGFEGGVGEIVRSVVKALRTSPTPIKRRRVVVGAVAAAERMAAASDSERSDLAAVFPTKIKALVSRLLRG
jgi:hypothetical protein